MQLFYYNILAKMGKLARRKRLTKPRKKKRPPEPVAVVVAGAGAGASKSKQAATEKTKNNFVASTAAAEATAAILKQ